MSIKWGTLQTAEDLLVKYKESKLSSLSALRDGFISGGLLYNGNVYQTRDKDIQDMIGALQVAQVAAQQNQEFNVTWLTEENQQVLLDLPTLTGLGVAVAQHKSYYVYKCREHKDNILALSTKEDIDNYLANLTW